MNDYLIHYGVLGMKWGVRRYQNKDGTLTEKGKKRQALAYKRMDNRTKFVTEKYDIDKQAVKLGTLKNIVNAANSDKEVQKVREMNSAIKANQMRTLEFGNKTFKRKIANIAGATVVNMAAVAAIVTETVAFPIAAIPMAAVTAGALYLNKLIMR